MARLVSGLENATGSALDDGDIPGLILDNMEQGVVFRDESGVIRYANPAYSRLSGRPLEDVVGRRCDEVFGGRQWVCPGCCPVGTCSGQAAQLVDHALMTMSGDLRSVQFSVTTLSGDRATRGSIIFLDDVTENADRAPAAAEVARRLEHLRVTVRGLANCDSEEEILGFAADTARTILAASTSAALTLDQDTLVSRAVSSDRGDEAAADANIDLEAAEEALRQHRTFPPDQPVSRNRDQPGGHPCRLSVALGGFGVLQVWAHPESSFTADDQRMLELLADHVGQALGWSRLRAELEAQAIQDPLTGVYNRRYLTQMIEVESRRSTRSGMPIAFLMVDVDGLKEINDRLGHIAGDRMLQEVAALLLSAVRATDVLVRYGGDEFVILLPETGDEAIFLKQRIRDEIAARNREHCDAAVPISVSLGSAVWHPGGRETFGEVLDRADQNMYHSKRRQRAEHRRSPGWLSGRGQPAREGQRPLHPGHEDEPRERGRAAMSVGARSLNADLPTPGVVNWFKVYCVAMAVLYLVCTVAGVLFIVFADEITGGDAELSRPEALIAGAILLGFGLVLLALFAGALFLPNRPWVWIYHLVLICIGLTSACTMPATIPLLIFWIKPETRAWYGRLG